MMTSFKDQIRFRVPTFRWITYFQWLVAVGWFVSLSLSLIVAYAPATKNCTGSDVCGQWTTAGNVAWEALFRPAWGVCPMSPNRFDLVASTLMFDLHIAN